jgi:FMN phosphatase YigB (HAD superfamily)
MIHFYKYIKKYVRTPGVHMQSAIIADMTKKYLSSLLIAIAVNIFFINGISIASDALRPISARQSQLKDPSPHFTVVETAALTGLQEFIDIIRNAPKGSIVFADIDETLIRHAKGLNFPGSGSFRLRHSMVRPIIGKIFPTMSRQNRDQIADMAIAEEYWSRQERHGSRFYALVEGAKELYKVAQERALKIVLITNRDIDSKRQAITIRILQELDISGHIIFCGIGPLRKANKMLEAIEQDIQSRDIDLPPRQIFFIDDSRSNIEDAYGLFAARGVFEGISKIRIFHLQPVTKPIEYTSLKTRLLDSRGDDAEVTILLLNAILAIHEEHAAPQDRWRRLNEIVNIIEARRLNVSEDFVFETYIYKYLYEIAEGLLIAGNINEFPQASVLVDPESVYFRIVFPFNYNDALESYRQGQFSLDMLRRVLYGRYLAISERQTFFPEDTLDLLMRRGPVYGMLPRAVPAASASVLPGSLTAGLRQGHMLSIQLRSAA